jgi:RimJ/RimL family protein N-acetyltransferase
MGFNIKQGTLKTDELCMLSSVSYPLEVAIQVVANGSIFENFLTFRDLLLCDGELRNSYHQLKQACAGYSDDDYRSKKSSFIEGTLANAKSKLITKRLILRPYITSDWHRIHAYSADPDFSKYELWGPNTLEDTHKYVAAMIEQAKAIPRFKFDFAVCLKSNGLLIGSCGIRRETETSLVANLGWAINPEFQNQGFATEAARSVIDFGLNELKLKVIYATCDTRNTPSFKVMEKLGMKRVGLIKGTKEVKGHIRDSYRYEL